jgi:hypothetical protein
MKAFENLMDFFPLPGPLMMPVEDTSIVNATTLTVQQTKIHNNRGGELMTRRRERKRRQWYTGNAEVL